MIAFKKIHESDLEMIMNWRSSKEVSKYLVTEIKKDINLQQKWFNDQVKNKNPPQHWLIVMGMNPIGFISMNDYIPGESTSWGYYIGDKKFWHVGGLISAYFYNYIFFKRDPRLKKIKGHYFLDNTKIRKLHSYYGCIEVKTLPNHIEKDGVKHDIINMEMPKDIWLRNQDKFKSYIADFEE